MERKLKVCEICGQKTEIKKGKICGACLEDMEEFAGMFEAAPAAMKRPNRKGK